VAEGRQRSLRVLACVAGMKSSYRNSDIH
jgi:hypothetical protein